MLHLASKTVRGVTARERLTVINKSGKDVKVCWVGYDGEAIEYATLPNLQAWSTGTYTTHYWLVEALDGSFRNAFCGDSKWVQVVKRGVLNIGQSWGEYSVRGSSTGLKITAFDCVSRRAVKVAERLIDRMLEDAPSEVLAGLQRAGCRVAIIGRDQVPGDIPEHSYLRLLLPAALPAHPPPSQDSDSGMASPRSVYCPLVTCPSAPHPQAAPPTTPRPALHTTLSAPVESAAAPSPPDPSPDPNPTPTDRGGKAAPAASPAVAPVTPNHTPRIHQLWPRTPHTSPRQFGPYSTFSNQLFSAESIPPLDAAPKWPPQGANVAAPLPASSHDASPSSPLPLRPLTPTLNEPTARPARPHSPLTPAAVVDPPLSPANWRSMLRPVALRAARAPAATARPQASSPPLAPATPDPLPAPLAGPAPASHDASSHPAAAASRAAPEAATTTAAAAAESESAAAVAAAAAEVESEQAHQAVGEGDQEELWNALVAEGQAEEGQAAGGLPSVTLGQVACRGQVATREVPTLSCCEENLLLGPNNAHKGESVLVHGLARAVWEFGLDADLRMAVRVQLQKALHHGLYPPGCRMTASVEDYWAEAARAWFHATVRADTNGGINTRAKLAARDPGLARLLHAAFGNGAWRYPDDCPAQFGPRRASAAAAAAAALTQAIPARAPEAVAAAAAAVFRQVTAAAAPREAVGAAAAAAKGTAPPEAEAAPSAAVVGAAAAPPPHREGEGGGDAGADAKGAGAAVGKGVLVGLQQQLPQQLARLASFPSLSAARPVLAVQLAKAQQWGGLLRSRLQWGVAGAAAAAGEATLAAPQMVEQH